jgi:CBS domain-containing protein
MNVSDIMVTMVETARPDTNLAAVAKLMWDHDCGFIPVVDASGSVVGVITDRDICIAAATRGQPPDRLVAAEVMSGPVRACLPEDPIDRVLAEMKQFRVRRLPVIDTSGRLKGVISMNDIVLAAERAGGPSPKPVLSAIAGICRHRGIQAASAA